MENQIQIFEHEQFGKIRTVIIDGRIHFVAVDVCLSLKIKNSRDALTRLESDEKMTVDLTDSHSGKRGGAQFMTVVNEPGLYRLIFSSRKKEALEFQRWVYHEVLPSIRKTGSYSVAAKEKPAVNPKRREGQLSDARVYVLEMSDGSVQIAKIGLSKNIRARAAKAKRDTGSTVKDIYFTPVMSRENARLVEWACHEKFSSRRVKGEFFSVDFAEVCAVVEYFAKLVAAAPIVSDLERGGKILKLVDRKFD